MNSSRAKTTIQNTGWLLTLQRITDTCSVDTYVLLSPFVLSHSTLNCHLSITSLLSKLRITITNFWTVILYSHSAWNQTNQHTNCHYVYCQQSQLQCHKNNQSTSTSQNKMHTTNTIVPLRGQCEKWSQSDNHYLELWQLNLDCHVRPCKASARPAKRYVGVMAMGATAKGGCMCMSTRWGRDICVLEAFMWEKLWRAGGLCGEGAFVFTADEHCTEHAHACHCAKFEQNQTIPSRVIAILDIWGGSTWTTPHTVVPHFLFTHQIRWRYLDQYRSYTIKMEYKKCPLAAEFYFWFQSWRPQSLGDLCMCHRAKFQPNGIIGSRVMAI